MSVDLPGGGIHDCSRLGVSLIQSNAPHLHSRLDRMALLDPRQVVDFGKRIAYPDTDAVVIQSRKIGRNRDGVRNSGLINVSGIGGAAVITELDLIDEG